MNIEEKVCCLEAIKNIKESEIGKYAIKILENLAEKRKDSIGIVSIEQKLKSNLFSSFNDFYAEIKGLIVDSAKIMGLSTQKGIILQTVLFKLDEELISINQPKKNKMESKIQRVSDLLNHAIEFAPDSLKEIKSSFVMSQNSLPMKETEYDQSKYPEYSQSEIASIFDDIMKVNRDEIVRDIYHIIRTYEKGISPSRGIVSFDLVKLSPYTLSLIKTRVKDSIIE